ncbi:PH (Pleckstrin Homology) domain-containing protein [Agromyces ramosus]|uniref:PH (Pleckstrin Homology) domain-containing protein n=1 Tax=Agromyces ramosus TaxID=33879 RepID=A0A4Q7MKJ2_9MICO|nr:PH (Pleckstrin Homology) domain-containing protein [Agromyces ramosus]
MLILPVLLLMATAGAATYALLVLPELWQRLAVGAVTLLVVLFGCLLPFLAWLTRRTTITSRRIIMRRGVFARERRELLHSRGYDVVVRRTWIQGTFGSGDVRINTGHEHPFVIADVPNPFQVQAALHELMEGAHTLVADRRRADQSMADGDTVAWGGR